MPMTDQASPPFAGVAGRRTFLRETDDGAIIVYGIVERGAQQTRFCARPEWDEWCEKHAPPVAMPGMGYHGATKALQVVRVLDAGTLEVLVTEKRILTQEQADRMVRRFAAEAKAKAGPVPDSTGEQDDGA